MAEGEHPNCHAVEEFLNAIPHVSRPITRTERMDDVPVPNGYTSAWHDPIDHRGFTAISWGDGHFLAITDGNKGVTRLSGKIEDAASFGAQVNKLLFG